MLVVVLSPVFVVRTLDEQVVDRSLEVGDATRLTAQLIAAASWNPLNRCWLAHQQTCPQRVCFLMRSGDASAWTVRRLGTVVLKCRDESRRDSSDVRHMKRPRRVDTLNARATQEHRHTIVSSDLDRVGASSNTRGWNSHHRMCWTRNKGTASLFHIFLTLHRSRNANAALSRPTWQERRTFMCSHLV